MILLEINSTVITEALQMFLLITLLVFTDTFTKWCSISTTYNKDNSLVNTPWNILRGIFFRAWKKGYLESGKYREELGKKSIVYLMTILMAIIVNLMPDYKFQGIQADKTIAFFIYLAIVLAECFSIAENFKEMGVIQGNWITKAVLAVLAKYGIQDPTRQQQQQNEREVQK